MIAKTKSRKKTKEPAEHPPEETTSELDVLKGRMLEVWDRHISKRARLAPHVAAFVGQVVDGEVKLLPGSKAADKARAIVEDAGATGLGGHGPKSPATRVAEAEEPAATTALRGEGRDLPIDRIQPSGYNPRKEFPEAELLDLAASIMAHGLLEPIVVRPIDGDRYELVAGERRLKACLRAGLAKVPAIVRRLDDRQAREICVLENLQRKDLSPIEEAEGFKMLLEGPDAPTQTELGARLGVSQAHIANRLGLLRLPDSWRKRLAAGQITATHARALVPLADRPKVLKGIEKEMEWSLDSGNVGSAEAFEGDVEDALFRQTRRLVGKRYVAGGVHVSHFTPTDEQREALDIIKVPGDDGKPIEVACNTALWDKLEKAHEAAAMERKAKPANGQAAKPDRPPTAAQKKAQETADRERQKELAEQFARRIAAWKTDWLRYLIARELADAGECGDRRLVRMLLYFAASPGTFRTLSNIHERAELLSDRLKLANVPAKSSGPSYARILDVWASIGPLPAQGRNDVLLVAREFVRALFWTQEDGPGQTVPPDDVAAIAAWLKIDIEAAWKREQAGPLTEPYLVMHNREQLAAIGREWEMSLLGTEPKNEMLNRMMSLGRPTTLPAELAERKARAK